MADVAYSYEYPHPKNKKEMLIFEFLKLLWEKLLFTLCTNLPQIMLHTSNRHVGFSADMEIVVSFATFILLLSSNVKIAPLL